MTTRYRELTGGNYRDEFGYVQVKQRTTVNYDALPLASRWREDPVTYWYLADAIRFDSKTLDRKRKEEPWLEEFRTEEPSAPFVAVK